MKKIISILCLVALFSCDTSKKKKNKETMFKDKPVYKRQLPVKIREFHKDEHLFLNFYDSMSPLEFRNRANTDLKSERLFYRDYKDNNRDKNNFPFISLLDSNSFPNSKGFDHPTDFPYNFESYLYYPINTFNKTYYVNILTVFDNKKLTSISLLGPSFFVPSNHPYGRDKIINEGKIFKNEIIKIYSEKYGEPKTTLRCKKRT